MKTVLLIFLFISVINGQELRPEDKKCLDVVTDGLKEGSIVFGYSAENRPGNLEAIIIFDGKEFVSTEGKELKGLSIIFRLSDGKKFPIQFGAYYSQLGLDRCIWFGKFISEKPENSELFSYPKSSLITEIDSKTSQLFYSINQTCIDQGDWPPHLKPPCSKPILKAVSDFNSNGRLEFWYSDPYTWATGFAVGELDESGKSIKKISEKCLDCD